MILLRFSFIDLVGVSLKLRGVTIPNNSLVDIEDLLLRRPNDPVPSNANGFHDQALLCVTDLVECCESPPRGNWYYPDGHIVALDNGQDAKFQSNRSQYSEETNVNGSVRLWSRGHPKERGHFRCELPSATNPSVNQTLYVTILCKLCY